VTEHTDASNVVSRRLAETYERSPVPLYLQVAAVLRRRIEDGHWPPAAKMSTLEELEREFQVARVTVRQAVELLEKQGLVERKQGKGTFVTGELADRRWLKLDLKWSSLIDAIRSNVPEFLEVRDPSPTGPTLRPADGRAAKEWTYLCSVQHRDGEPYVLARVHLAKHVFDQAPEAFTRSTAASVLDSLESVRIGSARQSFVVSSAGTNTAELMRVALNTPTVEARLVVTDKDGLVIYVGEIIYRGDCVRLDVDLLQ
jgi:GntR family transcriptional regulator